MTTQKLYTIKEAQPILNRKRLSILENIKNGKLKATLTVIEGRCTHLIDHDDLMEYIAKRDGIKS